MGTSSTDMEMEMEMEMEPGSSSAMNHHHHQHHHLNNNENMKSLLTMARQLIDQGRPSLALQAVVAAVKSEAGDKAVFHTLHRARELYKNNLRSSSAADELALLFAECAIAEAKPLTSEPLPTSTGNPPGTVTPDANGSSILAKTGRNQIMLDFFSDGSSFICLQCGGLVSNHRKEEHLAYWCCQI